MSELGQLIRKPEFWFGTVVVGIVLDCFVKPLLMRFFKWAGLISLGWLKKSYERESAERIKVISEVADSDQKQLLYMAKLLDLRIRAAFLLMGSMGCGGFSIITSIGGSLWTPVFFVGGALVFWGCIWRFQEAMNLHSWIQQGIKNKVD